MNDGQEFCCPEFGFVCVVMAELRSWLQKPHGAAPVHDSGGRPGLEVRRDFALIAFADDSRAGAVGEGPEREVSRSNDEFTRVRGNLTIEAGYFFADKTSRSKAADSGSCVLLLRCKEAPSFITRRFCP